MKYKKTIGAACIIICVLLCVLFMFAGCGNDKEICLSGNGEPDSQTGSDGDYYVDISKNQLYRKTNGRWFLVASQQHYTDNEIILPEVIYACVGQQLEIYFRNVISYSLDDVLISTGTDMPDCKQFSDKWTGTPKKAGIYAFVISLFTKTDRQLIGSRRTSIVVKDGSVQSITALTIGDSTLYSGDETRKMLELAKNDNTDLTLLGTMSVSEENRYEGRVGWKASNYVKDREIDGVINPLYNADSQQFDFEYYMKHQNYKKVDAVFLQLGINDVFNALSDSLSACIDSYIESLDTIIASVLKYDSEIKIIINPIIPCCQNQDEFGKVYGVRTVWEYMKNTYFANLKLLQKFTNIQNVYVSFYHASLDAVRFQTKDVHPSTEGYEQLGTQMYYYMKAVTAA